MATNIAVATSKAVSPSTTVTKLSGLQKEVFALYRTVLRAAYKKDCPTLSTTGSVSATTEMEASTSSLPAPSKSFIADIRSSKSNVSTLSYAREEFRKKAASVPRNDFKHIEHMIRQGHKDVKMLQMPGVRAVRGGP